MSDYATALSGLVIQRDERRDGRLAALMENQGVTRAEAAVIDEAVTGAIYEALRAVGAGMDTLTPPLQVKAFPLMLNMFADNAAKLEEIITSVVFGAARPTPGCDCSSCAPLVKLHAEMDATMSAGNVQ
jgi:hypothetical protein